MPKTCTAIKKVTGEPCSSPALGDSSFCFFHDPAKAEARKLAAQAGGKNKKPLNPIYSDEEITSGGWSGVEEKLVQTINALCQGVISPSSANTTCFWANGYLQVGRKIKHEECATTREKEERSARQGREEFEQKYSKRIASVVLDPPQLNVVLNAVERIRWLISPHGLETQRRWRREHRESLVNGPAQPV